MNNPIDQNNHDIVPSGVFIANMASILLAMLAAYPPFGIPAAIAAAGFGITGEAATFVNSYRDRKAQRTREKLEKVCSELNKRLHQVETTIDDEKIDLFLEVTQRAIEDDEERKTALYSAILEWIIRDSPNPVHVRVVADGVRNLNYVELYAVLMEGKGWNAGEVVRSDGLSESTWLKRASTYGLAQDGIRTIGSLTPFAAMLDKYVPFDELPPPNAAARRARN